MIVEKATFLSSLKGSLNDDFYLRGLPGRPGWAVACPKPQYDEKEKAKMRERKEVKAFINAQDIAKQIYRDPVQKQLWGARYEREKANMEKHKCLYNPVTGKPNIPMRLWDYVKSEVSKAIKNGQTDTLYLTENP